MAGTSGFYTDLNEAQWAIAAPLLPAAKPGGRPRTGSVSFRAKWSSASNS